MELTPRQTEIVDFLRQRPRTSYEISEEFGITESTTRWHIAEIRDTIRNENVDIVYNDTTKKYSLSGEIETEEHDEVDLEEIAAHLEDGLTYNQFYEIYGLSKERAQTAMDKLRRQGYTIDFKVIDDQTGKRFFYIPDERGKQYKIGDGDGRYRFALMSDTHLGSTAEHLDELNDFYDRLVEEGISMVFHAGDISDGIKVHKGHINVLKGEATNWDRMLNYVVDNYPRREGIHTIFIEGNHDHKFHRRNGIHFGELISRRRDDLHYAGDSMARFVFDEENDIDMELIHPAGGQPYSVGYRVQTLYRDRPTEQRPTIAGIGHLHGSLYVQTEGVKAFYTGCWKGLTTWGKRKGHNACIGGWIVDLHIEDGEVRSLVPQWIGYEAENTTNNFSMQDINELIAQ